mmetsp:Transcript_34996/g.68908  ORF Transcript_34996/g.68908 Transcript_34996/m.68908 type:complete len:204 (-) Transcript_34996:211-822(-)
MCMYFVSPFRPFTPATMLRHLIAVLCLSAGAASALSFGPRSGGNGGGDRTAMYLATPFVARRLLRDNTSVPSPVAPRPRRARGNDALAMAIPGYGTTEQVVVGGLMNFLSIFNGVITVRILLSWFPQSQGIAILKPVFQISDPYLNLFRGVIPPIFGLDLSPILAFVTLNVATSATASLGCDDVPSEEQWKEIRARRARQPAL